MSSEADDPLVQGRGHLRSCTSARSSTATTTASATSAASSQKLDYIQELGVNTIWLLPFYPSPGKDDGYDIADYRKINPALRHASRTSRQFVHEAHRRELRVITELVINHTSDQHPWFQAARRAPPGSRKRDYYVWSDDPTKYAGTRIIFTDTETSNWALDPVAQVSTTGTASSAISPTSTSTIRTSSARSPR